MLERDRPDEVLQMPTMEALVRILPLDRCTVGENYFTGEREWRAPQNFAFQLTGRFSIPGNPPGASEPTWSRDQVIADNPDLYAECLTKTKGDITKALRMVLKALHDDDWPDWGYYDPPVSYIGNLISVSSGQIIVKQDPEVFYSIGSNSRIYVEDVLEGVEFDLEQVASKTHYVWNQNLAEVDIKSGGFEITLIEVEDPKPAIYTQDQTTLDRIEVPHVRRGFGTSTDYCEVLFNGKYTEEQRLAVMRWKRERGDPFSDDPLRNLIIRTELETAGKLRALYQSVDEIKGKKRSPDLIIPGGDIWDYYLEEDGEEMGTREGLREDLDDPLL